MRATPNQVRAVPGARARARHDRNTDQGRRRHPGVLDRLLPLTRCAVTRGQLRRQGVMDSCGMHDGQGHCP
jgi:hypothetical protein